MALSTQPYKGARDFYPEDKRLQKYIFGVMRKTVEKYGYEEYDAPILEPMDLFLAKTGDEIVNEQTYAFKDRGDRDVVIRPEMTPTVSRMVAAKRQELAYPLRWYSIPNLWRYERPQRGRLREHWQLNVDLFGLSGLEAEHEVIMVADAIMQAFKAKRDMYSIRLNSRKLMNAIMDYLSLNQVQTATLIKLIDHMHKIDHAAFVAEVDALFTPTQRETGKSDELLNLLKITSLDGLPSQLLSHESVKELKALIKVLNGSKITNVAFDITIMRGFDYYTDIVFEVFDNDPENNRSMFGGGRYDGLVGLFDVEPLPTIGFGMGDVTLANFLETHGLAPKLKVETDIYVVLVGDDMYPKAQHVVTELRNMGLNVAMDPGERKADKQIKTAVKKGIHHALFIGEKELEDEQYTLKNLDTGEEEKHSLERIVSMIKDHRKK